MSNSFKKFISDMFTSNDSGIPTYSHTKLWSNIGLLAMTGVFVWYGYKGTLEEWYAWMYALTVTPTRLLNRVISLKYGAGNSDNGANKQQPEEHRYEHDYEQEAEKPKRRNKRKGSTEDNDN